MYNRTYAKSSIKYSGRGRNVPDEVTEEIAKIRHEYPSWKAKRVLEELHKRLREWESQYREGWPGLSFVQKKLKELSRNDDNRTPESKGLDQPWGISTLIKYPINPEALPSVIEAWVYYQENMLNPEFEPRAFSIRMARWVARLYKCYDKIDHLVNTAYIYMLNEVAAELSKTNISDLFLDLSVYEKVTDDVVIENDERLQNIICGLNLPANYISYNRQRQLKEQEEAMFIERKLRE